MNKPTSRTLQPGDEADLEAFLLEHLESSMFLLGNARAAGLGDHGKPLQGTYTAVSPELESRCRSSVIRYTQERRMWILEVAGTPVACSAFNTVVGEAVQVGGVWTPPENRGRGYGRSVVAASLADARARGVTKGVLFTGVNNQPAQRAYKGVGFRYLSDYRMLLLNAPLEL